MTLLNVVAHVVEQMCNFHWLVLVIWLLEYCPQYIALVLFAEKILCIPGFPVHLETGLFCLF